MNFTVVCLCRQTHLNVTERQMYSGEVILMYQWTWKESLWNTMAPVGHPGPQSQSKGHKGHCWCHLKVDDTRKVDTKLRTAPHIDQKARVQYCRQTYRQSWQYAPVIPSMGIHMIVVSVRQSSPGLHFTSFPVWWQIQSEKIVSR